MLCVCWLEWMCGYNVFRSPTDKRSSPVCIVCNVSAASKQMKREEKLQKYLISLYLLNTDVSGSEIKQAVILTFLQLEVNLN